MIGKILFMSAAALMAYRYISRSNRKARELRQKADVAKLLPPEPASLDEVSHARLIVGPAAETTRPPRTTLSQASLAVEPDPGH